jgi:hypothetical protein
MLNNSSKKKYFLYVSKEINDDPNILYVEKFKKERDINRAFKKACKYGKINIARWLYSKCNLKFSIRYSIIKSCEKGHLNIVEWLFFRNGQQILENIEDMFYASCINGHINIVKWLYKLFNNHVTENDTKKYIYNGFVSICKNSKKIQMN